MESSRSDAAQTISPATLLYRRSSLPRMTAKIPTRISEVNSVIPCESRNPGSFPRLRRISLDS